MKWMGGWSYGALRSCPQSYIGVIAEMMKEEADALDPDNVEDEDDAG